MHKEEINIAEAKAHFSELINKVAYAHEEIIITKRGKPVAVLSNPSDKEKGLASVKGWLDGESPFLKTVSEIVSKRHKQKLRVMTKGKKN